MISNRIENIIAKFLTSQASASELSELELWIEDANNLEMFNRYVKINYAIEYNMKEFDSYGVKSKLQEAFARENKERKLKKLRKIIYYSAAAVVLGIVTTTYFYKSNLFDKPVATPVVVKNTIEAGTDKAILTLEDGSAVVLEKDKTYQKNNVVCNGKQLVYDSKNKTQSALVYNYLTIPRGGQFQIKLSDGTKVWLNSETKLKFPVAFKEGSTRQVELVYGEAFLMYHQVLNTTEQNLKY